LLRAKISRVFYVLRHKVLTPTPSTLGDFPMANLERCVESNPQPEANNNWIDKFLTETYQIQNRPQTRCPGFVDAADVELFESEKGKEHADTAVAAANTENFDPRQNGFEYLKTHKNPTDIAEQYAKDWQQGHYQFWTPFLTDIYDVAKSSADKAATLKLIENKMNELMKNDPKDTQVALDLRPDNTILMRFGNSSSFYRHIIDLNRPIHEQNNRYSYDD